MSASPFIDSNETNTKPSSVLNVLTILSVVGNSIGLISSIFGYTSAKSNYEQLEKMMQSKEIANAPEFVQGMVNEKTLMIAQKTLENRLPIMIIGILGALLCLYGAFEMRKLKKQGYSLWMIGEVLPIVSMFLFVGVGAFSGFALLGYIFPAAFIILFTVYRKELVY